MPTTERIEPTYTYRAKFPHLYITCECGDESGPIDVTDKMRWQNAHRERHELRASWARYAGTDLDRELRAIGCMERHTEGENRRARHTSARAVRGDRGDVFRYASHAGCVPTRCVVEGVHIDANGMYAIEGRS